MRPSAAERLSQPRRSQHRLKRVLQLGVSLPGKRPPARLLKAYPSMLLLLPPKPWRTSIRSRQTRT